MIVESMVERKMAEEAGVPARFIGPTFRILNRIYPPSRVCPNARERWGEGS